MEEDNTKSANPRRAAPAPFFLLFLFLFSFNWESEPTDRRPDAVSTLLICPDRIELYGVQQLSGAVAPLEEKQKR